MFTSKLGRNTLLVAAVTGALALVPVAGAQSSQGSPDAFERAVAARVAQDRSSAVSPDAFDRAVTAKLAQEAASFDSREHPQLALPKPMPDLVERTIRRRELDGNVDFTRMPDAFARAATAGGQAYVSESASSGRLDWHDFGLGAATGVALLLLVGGVGIGVSVARQAARPVSST